MNTARSILRNSAAVMPPYLAAACVYALNLHFVARLNPQARL